MKMDTPVYEAPGCEWLLVECPRALASSGTLEDLPDNPIYEEEF